MEFVVDFTEAESDLDKLLREVGSGAEVLITRDGLPVARLVPAIRAAKNRVPGSAKGLFKVPDDFDAPLPDFREYT